MKRILFLLSIFLTTIAGFSQYNPAEHTAFNKAVGIAQAVPTDARSYFYDRTLFKYRLYQSLAEVNAYLNITKYRVGHFPIYINVGGTLQSNGTFTGGTVTEYWYRDGTANSDLIAKLSGGGTSETLSGTVAQISALNTSVGKVYMSTDRGGALWADVGPYDGQVEIDSIKHLRSVNNRLLKKLGNDPVRVSEFGAISGDGIDDRIAVQAAVKYANDHSLKQLVWDGDYNLSDSVLDRRGGTQYVGLGALAREESWGGVFPSVYPTNEPYKGSSMIIAANKRGIVFDSTVVDPVRFKGIQFIKNGNRAVGTTTAIAFRSKFDGPTWPFIIEECHFRGFNFAIKIENPNQYNVAFVRIEDNAFSQNDECLYFGDIPLNNTTSIGQRNAVWGFRFTGNKCHDNSRIIRANFSFNTAYIGFNNGEGNIAYANGTYPYALIDFEFSKTTVKLEGNHFEGVTGVKTCVRASSQFLLSNGTYQAIQGTTQNSSENRLLISGGNSFNGVTGVTSIEATGCHVESHDPIGIRGSAVYFDNTINHEPGLLMAERAKTEGSTYKFGINGMENQVMHRNDLAWSASINASGGIGTRGFMMNTPVGLRQMAYVSPTFQGVMTQGYGGMDYSDNVKYIGATFLVNSPFKSDFFGNMTFYYSYTDGSGNAVSGSFDTPNTLYGVPIGWTYVTAYFPNIFPPNSTARTGYFGLATGELQAQTILVSTDYTVFGIKNSDPFVVPYFNHDQYTTKTGTFLVGQSFTDENRVVNAVTRSGTAGTLSGVTATGSLFGRYARVNDATNILPGQFLNILGYAYKVANVNADTVFLASQLNDDLNNSPVSYWQPTFDTYVSTKALTDSLNARGGAAIDYSSVIRNQTTTQTGANFKIDGMGHAAFLWSDNDVIAANLTIGNWVQYIANGRFVTRDQANARQMIELFAGANDAEALMWLHSGLSVEGPTSGIPATTNSGFMTLGQYKDSVGKLAFFLINSQDADTGLDSVMVKTNDSTAVFKKIDVRAGTGVTVSKSVTATHIIYTVNATGMPTGVLPEFTNNAAAIDAGYRNGEYYRTGDFVKQVHDDGVVLP